MWIILYLLSAVTTGFASVIMKKCSNNNNAKSIALIGLITSHILYIITSLIFTDVLKNFSIRFCLIDGQVSIAQPIHSSSIIITIIGSYFILHEKISWKKWLMILGVIICVILLSMKI